MNISTAMPVTFRPSLLSAFVLVMHTHMYKYFILNNPVLIFLAYACSLIIYILFFLFQELEVNASFQ